jgi:hypothetical protein
MLMLYVSICQAQPGYQGKKLSVQGNLLVMPALTNASYSQAPTDIAINSTQEVSVNYVVGKRKSLGASYRHLRTSNLYMGEEAGVSKEKIYTHSIGFHYQLFSRKPGNIAPLGKYFQVGGGVLFNKVQTQEKNDATSFKMYALRIGKGRSKILFNQVILSGGWELAYMFTGFNKEGWDGATYYYKDDRQTQAQYRLLRHAMFNVKIGLGFLAF